MIGGDEVETVLRQIAEQRRIIVDKLAHGAISPDNVQGGYMAISGYVRGLDAAEKIVREVFRGWLPEVLWRDTKPK